MPSDPRHPTLEQLDPLVGTWESEATHRLMPGVIIRGQSTFEWMPGELVLIWRSAYDHPDIPDSISILTCGDPTGADDTCTMHYVDQRSVTRVFQFSAEPGVFRYQRDHPGFSQRFTGTFSPDGNTLSATVELNQDDKTWQEDMLTTYRRLP